MTSMASTLSFNNIIKFCFVMMTLLTISIMHVFASEQSNSPEMIDDPESQVAGCCGGKADSWSWKRYLDGELVDQGGWNVSREGVSYTIIPASNGGVLKLTAIKFPRPESQSFPLFDPNKRYFNGVAPEIGIIFAEEHTEGEYWVFEIGGRHITDRRGFVKGKTNVRVSTTLSDGKPYLLETQSSNGYWVYVECESGLKWAFGGPGCQREELELAWLEMELNYLEINDSIGGFFANQIYDEQVWTVEVDNEVYTLTSD